MMSSRACACASMSCGASESARMPLSMHWNMSAQMPRRSAGPSRCLGPAERLGICADIFQCIDSGIRALSLAPQLIDAQAQARELIIFKRPASKNREILVDDLRSGRHPRHLDLRREGRLVISFNRLQAIYVVRRIQEERLGKQAAQPIDARTQSA